MPSQVSLSAAHAHATLGEKMVSFVTKLNPCRIIFKPYDKFLFKKLIKDSFLMRFQVDAGTVQQITKNRDFEIRDIICLDPTFNNPHVTHCAIA